MRRLADVYVGLALDPQQQTLDQARLIRYAGASGDFNPLHWSSDVAASVSPTGGIIAHGMLNMGIVARVVTAWAGGPAYVRALSVTFRAPCPVGATVTFGGEVVEVDTDGASATLAIWAELPSGERVIDRRRSRAVVAVDGR